MTAQGSQKVIWHTALSVDGFITGPDEAMDWVFEHGKGTSMADDVMNTIGAILCGRRTYDFGSKSTREETDEAYGGRWKGPEFCLTHEPPENAGGDLEFVTEGIHEAVRVGLEAARSDTAAPGENLLILGADIAGQAAAEGLVDELVVHVSPILLGDGTRLYGAPSKDRPQGFPQIELERLELGEGEQVTDMRFRVLR